MLYNTWLHMASCLRTMILYMVERKYANGLKHQTQALNATSKRKHKTQALMGATRLASGKDAAII